MELREVVFRGHRVSSEEDEAVLQLCSGDGNTIMNVLKITAQYT
jgi:hypothetical protein